MKILVITPTIKPTSGAGRYSHAVLQEFQKKGISFVVLTERGANPETYEQQVLSPERTVVAFVKNIIEVRRATKECDIVHSFDGWPYAVYARLALIGLSKPLFINAVGTYAVAALKSPLKGWLLKNTYTKAEKIFSISKFVRNRVLSYIKLDTIEVAYLGTTPMREPSEEELRSFKTTYGITSQSPILLTVGALKDRKGQYETVQAVSILKNKYPGILYCIVGTRAGAEAYVEKINTFVKAQGLEKNVKVVSDITTDVGLACAYQTCDIFVLNSKFDEKNEHAEGFGLVLLEAAQFGKPVIGSKGSGIPEAMEDGYNGYLVDRVTKEEIARAIQKVITEYDKLAKNSFEVAKRFSWEKTADTYIKEYTK